MNEQEMKAVLLTAQDTLRSRSKFALFCVELAEQMYPVFPNGVLPIRTPEAQAESELFWATTRPFFVIQQ